MVDKSGWVNLGTHVDISARPAGFDSKMFIQYRSQAEAMNAAKKISNYSLQYGWVKVYAELSLPLEVPAARSTLHSAKDILVDGGVNEYGLWADTELCTRKCGQNPGCNIFVTKGKIDVIFEDVWKEYSEGAAWQKGIRQPNDRIFKKPAPTKGLGKGKGKKGENHYEWGLPRTSTMFHLPAESKAF